MNRYAQPHVSAAVKQLRGWVTLCATVVALCGLTQAFVFAFVQYTDVRFAEVRAVKAEAPLRVVAAGAAVNGAEQEVGSGVRGLHEGSKGSVAIAREKTAFDNLLRRASGTACSIGTLSVLGLCVFSFMGVAVAGGGEVPGVERVVTSAAWSLVMAFLVLPWGEVMPSLGVPGIFAGYEMMVSAVETHQAAGGAVIGNIGAILQWVAMPLVAGFAATGVCLWFRSGVEKGVIITAPSQLDRAVEREASTLARRGGAPSAPRSVGALNRAIGDKDRVAVSPLEQALEAAAGSAGELAEETVGAAEGSGRKGRSVVDGHYRRLI